MPLFYNSFIFFSFKGIQNVELCVFAQAGAQKRYCATFVRPLWETISGQYIIFLIIKKNVSIVWL